MSLRPLLSVLTALPLFLLILFYVSYNDLQPRTRLHPQKMREIPKIRLRLLSCFFDIKRMHGDVIKFFGDQPEFERIELVESDPDFYVIQNYPTSGYQMNKSIVYHMEPVDTSKEQWMYLLQWFPGSYREFAFFGWDRFHLNNLEWHLTLSSGELLSASPNKTTEVLGIVVSNSYAMPGHKLRYDFVQYLDRNNFTMDVYGRSNRNAFKNHKGELPRWNKDAAILPYKYVFNAENCQLQNYMTEKIVDAIVGECLIFYWGCPNVEEWLNPRSYILLDLEDKEGAMRTIQAAIENDEWGKRIDAIREEKQKIITAYSLLPRTLGIVEFLKIKVVVLGSYIQLLQFADTAEQVNLNRYETVVSPDFNDTLRVHQNLWRRSIAQQETLLILQGDVKLKYNFVDRLTHLLQIRSDNGWERLIICHSTLEEEPWRLVRPVASKAVKAGPLHSRGYIVRPRGAQRLLDGVGREESESGSLRGRSRSPPALWCSRFTTAAFIKSNQGK